METNQTNINLQELAEQVAAIDKAVERLEKNVQRLIERVGITPQPKDERSK